MTSLHRLLWKWATGWALLVATFVGANFVLPADKSISRLAFGGDFLAFYTAGSFVKLGYEKKLYDLDFVQTYQHKLKLENDLPPTTAKLVPWWNPPFAAWAFAPFAQFRYAPALAVWELVNAMGVCASLGLLIHNYLGGLNLRCWKVWALFSLLVVCSCPVYQTFSHGQNTGVTLLLTTLVVVCWTSGRAFPAGLVAGMLFYKPQHAAILSVVLVLCLGRRAFLGLFMTGTMLLLVNLATLPGTLQNWLVTLPVNLKHLQDEVPYVWDRQVTFKAFWRLGLQGTAVGPTGTLATGLFIFCSAGLTVAFVVTYLKSRANRRTQSIVGPVLLCSPLLTPFCFDYDLLLLAIPAALYVSDRLANNGLTRADIWTGRLWVALYVWSFVNPGLAGRSGFNGTVVLLTGLACCELLRVWTRLAPAVTTSADLVGNLSIGRDDLFRPWSEAA